MGWFGGSPSDSQEASRLETVQKTPGQPDQVVTVDVVQKKPTKKICCACPDTKASDCSARVLGILPSDTAD